MLEKIFQIYNAVGRLEVKATLQNTETLAQIYNTLTEVRDELQAKEAPEEEANG